MQTNPASLVNANEVGGISGGEAQREAEVMEGGTRGGRGLQRKRNTTVTREEEEEKIRAGLFPNASEAPRIGGIARRPPKSLFFAVLPFRFRWLSEAPRRPQEGPRGPQERPKMAPRRPQERPRAPQERSKRGPRGDLRGNPEATLI